MKRSPSLRVSLVCTYVCGVWCGLWFVVCGLCVACVGRMFFAVFFCFVLFFARVCVCACSGGVCAGVFACVQYV